jgi:sterol desaturase/sphingolipid hydroxylase (fatty acid hydroxylase superfamily)
MVSEYAHPVEYMLGNCCPAGLGPKLLDYRCHVVTYCLWMALRVIETVDGHSGYDFPWSPFRILPFSAGAAYHDYHHYENIGNYCSFFNIWDTVFGTNTKYYADMAKKNKKAE